jgi:hypothetical protein
MSSKSDDLEEAQYYTKRLLSRQLPKLVWEVTLPENQVIGITGDLERDSHTIARGRIIEKIEDEAKRRAIEQPELYVTATYPMSTISSGEFQAGQIFIWEEDGNSLTFEDAINKSTYFRSFLSGMNLQDQRYVTIRVFADKEDKEWIKAFLNTDSEETKFDISSTSY